jgi:DNA-binding CsgD family transcriptional regulator
MTNPIPRPEVPANMAKPDNRWTLTPRQVEVVRLACLGLTAKETARQLGISKNTVDEHLSEARRRVGARTKSRLVGWAIAAGVVLY